LLQHPNLVCTPHLGASTEEAQINVARDIAQQMCDVFDQKEVMRRLPVFFLFLASFLSLIPPLVSLSLCLSSLLLLPHLTPVAAASIASATPCSASYLPLLRLLLL
jgi:hypothetical protein